MQHVKHCRGAKPLVAQRGNCQLFFQFSFHVSSHLDGRGIVKKFVNMYMNRTYTSYYSYVFLCYIVIDMVLLYIVCCNTVFIIYIYSNSMNSMISIIVQETHTAHWTERNALFEQNTAEQNITQRKTVNSCI